MDILLVTHAGGQIGLGHLSRSLTVAKSLHSVINARVQLLIQSPPIERSDLQEFTCDIISPEEDICIAAVEQFRKQRFQVAIFDLQRARRPKGLPWLLDHFRRKQVYLVGIDDVLDLQDFFDLLVIPSFLPEIADLSGALNGKILSGWDHLLLSVESPQPVPYLHGSHALVLTGGSDAAGLGKKWPSELATHLPDGSLVDWVTGPFSPPPKFPSLSAITFHEHRAPSGLSFLMKNTSFAMCVYGVSFFELLYYGIPTVVYSPYGNRDARELKALQQEELALIASSSTEAPRLLRQLMIDASLAKQLSQRAQSKIDGKGAERFAKALLHRTDKLWRALT